MPRSRSAIPALMLLLALASPLAVAAPPALSPAQESRAALVQKNLRCPLCDTGESIAESRSDISVKMRSSVREQVAAGRSDAEIYAYFAQRYGNFVLLDPPKSGFNLLLWGGPLLALLGGGAVWWTFLRGQSRTALAPGTDRTADPAGDDEPDPPDPYLAQVRRDTGRGGGG